MSHQDRVFFGNFIAVLGFLMVLAFVFFFVAMKVASKGDQVTEADPLTAERTLKNIRPVGQVAIAGNSSSKPAVAAAPPATAPSPAAAMEVAAGGRSGIDVFNTYCMACHTTGAAGAPKVGDKAAWEPRIAKGTDALLASAIKGLNAMPPKGTCMACSDGELMAAIIVMVEKSQ